MGIHFVIAQIVGNLALYWITKRTGLGVEAYYSQMVLLTGITGLITMAVSLYFYRKDKLQRTYGAVIKAAPGRRLGGGEAGLLLLMGAALAQYGNMFVGILQIFLKNTSYQEAMSRATDGKSLWTLIFWMGIVAPVAEEMIFRWLIFLRLRDYMRLAGAALISGALFGIYHGNILQAVYAGMLGVAFAYILETSGSLWGSVLLHIGGNTWALLLTQYGVQMVEKAGAAMGLVIYLIFPVIIVAGFVYFTRRYTKRECRRSC